MRNLSPIARRIIPGALLILSLMALCSCASTQDSSNSVDQPRVSTVPWNKPQNWEGGGQIGSMMGR